MLANRSENRFIILLRANTEGKPVKLFICIANKSFVNLDDSSVKTVIIIYGEESRFALEFTGSEGNKKVIRVHSVTDTTTSSSEPSQFRLLIL